MTDWGKACRNGQAVQVYSRTSGEISGRVTKREAVLLVDTAHETLALSVAALLSRADDGDLYEEWYRDECAATLQLKRKLAAARGQITKLKKRLEAK